MAKRKKVKPSVQRPSEPRVVYTEDMAASICEQVANGFALNEICVRAAMPSRSTVYKWLGQHPVFADMYARAREERSDLIADEIVTIADTEADHNKARVRIDARKWWAAKVNPKKYGDKLQTENTNRNFVISDKPMSQDEWERLYCLTTPGGSEKSTL